jgi:hypothetical protein
MNPRDRTDIHGIPLRAYVDEVARMKLQALGQAVATDAAKAAEARELRLRNIQRMDDPENKRNFDRAVENSRARHRDVVANMSPYSGKR